MNVDHLNFQEFVLSAALAILVVGGFVAWVAPTGQKRFGFRLGGTIGLIFAVLDALVGVWGNIFFLIVIIWMCLKGERTLAFGLMILVFFFYGIGVG